MPYCRRKCPYCDFFKKVPKAGERERFVQVLRREMLLAAKMHDWALGAPKTIYFGGGTPSLHTAEEIRLLLSNVQNVWGDTGVNLPRLDPTRERGGDEVEITLETNPGTVDSAKLKALRVAGVNRLSIGAQSFSARKLAMLHRDHTVQETRECVQLAKLEGFMNLSLDLIFGLPGETLEEWKADIEDALALEPTHVSLYNLEFHEGTVFDRWKNSGRLSPLDEDLEAEMYLMTHAMLLAGGYLHYEVSNFARPGFQSEHNSAYWKGSPYLGLGPSAHSFDGKRLRFENTADMHEYFRAIEGNRMPEAKREWLDEETRREDWISLRLRQSDGIQFDDAKRELGEGQAQELWKKAERLPQDARVLTKDQLRLTAEGWFRENEILLHLLQGE